MKSLSIILALLLALLAGNADARQRAASGSTAVTCPSPTTDGSIITAPTNCTLTGTFGSVGLGLPTGNVNNTSGITTVPNYELTGAGLTNLTSDGSGAGDNWAWNQYVFQSTSDGAMPATQLERNNSGNIYLKYSLTACPTAFPLGSPNPTALWFMQKPSGSSEAGYANWFQVSGPTSSTIPAITSSNGNTYPTILDAVKAGPAGVTINVPVMPTGIPYYEDVASGRQSYVGLDGMTLNFAAGVKVLCSNYGFKGTINISGNNDTAQGDATVPAEIGNNNSGTGGNAYGINFDQYTNNLTLANLLFEGSYDALHGFAPGVSTFTNVHAQNGDMIRDYYCGGFGLGHNMYVTPGGGAVFNGVLSSSTTLTASAVLGKIQIGTTLSGSGATAGTTVVSQLTQVGANPGGAGTYQVSILQSASGQMSTTSNEDDDSFTWNGGWSINVLGDQDPALAPNGNNGGDLFKGRLRKGLIEHVTIGGNLTGVTINTISGTCPTMFYSERWPVDMPCGGEWTIAHSTIEVPANTTHYGGHEFFAPGDEISSGPNNFATNDQRGSYNCGPGAFFVGDVLASNQWQLANIPVNPRIYGVDVGSNIFSNPNQEFTQESHVSSISGPDGNGNYTIGMTPLSNGFGFYINNNNNFTGDISGTTLSITAFLDYVPNFTGNIVGTTLTATGIYPCCIAAGQALAGVGVLSGTTILSGSGSTWTVSQSQSVSSEAMQAGNPLTSGDSLLDITGNITGSPTVSGGGAGPWVVSSSQSVASETMFTSTLATCAHGGLGACGQNIPAVGYVRATGTIASGTNTITLTGVYNPLAIAPNGQIGPPASVGWQAEMSCLPAGTTIITPRPTATTITVSANATTTCTNQPLVLERKHSLTLDHDYIITDAPNGGNDGINQLISSYSSNFIPVTISNSVMVTNSGQFSISGAGCSPACGQVVNGLTDPSVATVAAMNGNSVYATRALAATAIGSPWNAADQFGNTGPSWPFLPQAP
jgi:hypothetical protein